MTRKALALAMIALLIQLPVFVSAEIAGYTISGADGVHQVVRAQDTLSVDTLVRVTGDGEVTPDQVWLGTRRFDTCAAEGELWRCTLSLPQQAFSQSQSYSINLHNDRHLTPPTTFSLVDKRSGVLVLDSAPPVLQLGLSAAKAQDTLTVSFYAIDEASSSALGGCAGLREISFTTPLGPQTFTYAQGTCQASESFTLDVSNIAEGTYTMGITATDHLGQRFTSGQAFAVDRSGVVFSDVRITAEGSPLSHIGTAFQRVLVSVMASSDVDPSSMRADLGALNDKQDYSSLPGTCVPDGDSFRCDFTVDISPTAFGTRPLTFTATDDVGNPATQTIPVLIQRDVDGPRTLGLTTDASALLPYLTEDTTITVTFVENGAGLRAADVALDLSSLGLGVVTATSCSPGWSCRWEGIDGAVDDGSYTVTLQARDLLGNPLKAPFTAELVRDTAPPLLEQPLEIRTVVSELNYEGVTLPGDSIAVTAVLKEPGEIADAYMDVSAFISNAVAVQAESCTDVGDDRRECIFVAGPIDVSGYTRDTITFVFDDAQNNRLEVEKDFEVLSIDEALVDYFQHSVRCSPSRVDREVASIIEHRIYCEIALQGSAMPVDIQLGATSGEDERLFKRIELVDTGNPPVLKLTLHATDLDESDLVVTIPLLITARAGQSVNRIPETENVTIRLDAYNLPLGLYGESLEEKIDAAIEDAEGGIWDTIGTLNKVVFYAERLCNLVTTINTVASLMNVLGFTKRKTASLLRGGAGTQALAEALEVSGQQDQTVTSVLNSKMKTMWIGGDNLAFVNKFCKFISCNIFYDELWSDSETLEGIGAFQRDSLSVFNDIATLGGTFSGIGTEGGYQAYTIEKTGDDPDTVGGVSAQTLLKGGKLNPKDSIVISFATLCIPGIIHGLEKYRQIQCLYADCLVTSVDTGVPVAACDELKDHQTCKYVAGEIFQIAPLTGLVNYATGLLKNVLSSPLGIIDLISGAVCTQPIGTPGAEDAARWCLFNEVAGMVANIWSDLANIKDDWTIKSDYCAELDRHRRDT